MKFKILKKLNSPNYFTDLYQQNKTKSTYKHLLANMTYKSPLHWHQMFPLRTYENEFLSRACTLCLHFTTRGAQKPPIL